MIFRKNTWFASIVAVSCLLASAGLASAQAINVWYGESQDFGTPGVAQRWANILGNVDMSGDVTSLWYTLNGPSENRLNARPGPASPMGGRRLQRRDRLRRPQSGRECRGDHRSGRTESGDRPQIGDGELLVGQRLARNYHVDWTDNPNVQSKAQVVDGLWTTDATGLRCETMGYDRVIAIGDALWTDYEVSATITMNALDPAGFVWPSVSPGFGITLTVAGPR
jgi:hypothetical protein